jgi:hypothetical protein
VRRKVTTLELPGHHHLPLPIAMAHHAVQITKLPFFHHKAKHLLAAQITTHKPISFFLSIVLMEKRVQP